MTGMDRIAALEAAIADQRQQLAEACAEIARLKAAQHEDVAVSRRDWFRRAAVMSGAATAAALALDVVPAAAADGSTMLAGNQANAESTTTIFADGSDGSLYAHGFLHVTDTAFTDEDVSIRINPAAVTGYAGTVSNIGFGVAGFGTNGVWGLSSADSGFGVLAEATGSGGTGLDALASSTDGTAVNAVGFVGVSAQGNHIGVSAKSSGIGVDAAGHTCAVQATCANVGARSTRPDHLREQRIHRRDRDDCRRWLGHLREQHVRSRNQRERTARRRGAPVAPRPCASAGCRRPWSPSTTLAATPARLGRRRRRDSALPRMAPMKPPTGPEEPVPVLEDVALTALLPGARARRSRTAATLRCCVC